MKFLPAAFFVMLCFTATAQEYKIENGEVKLSTGICFKGATAELTPESDAAIITIKKYLDDKTYISLLRIEANVSLFNDNEKDQLISEKRAKTIYQKLVDAGVDCKRLAATAFGNTKPVADSGTQEGTALNTNIKFVNAAIRGRLIGGMPADGGGKLMITDCN